MLLSDAAIRAAKPTESPRKLTDGRGLYLLITPAGGRYWRLDYRFGGLRKTVALGVYPEVSLKEARQKRDTARRQIAQGIDPAAVKAALRRSRSGSDTFEAVAREWHHRLKPTWVPKHAEIVLRALEKNVFPWLGSRPITTIGAPEILRTLRRVESRGALASAHQLHQNISRVFRYAVATGRADRDPSADLKGALPPARKEHFAATTDPAQIARILRMIDGYHGSLTVRCALQMAPLVFVRPGELARMAWADIDLESREWRYRVTKTAIDHIVPLSEQALAVLDEIRPLTGSGPYVFESHRQRRQHLGANTLVGALRGLGIPGEEMTIHGWRAVARTLLDEQLGFQPHLIEHQLAHAVRDPLGRAYNRTAHLPERKAMMQAWADYLDELRSGTGKVLPFRGTAKGPAA